MLSHWQVLLLILRGGGWNATPKQVSSVYEADNKAGKHLV
jgi:hypothetical protein